jgi:hypothetical protein
VYSYAITSLEQNVKRFVSRYNAEVGRHPGCGTQCFPFYTYAEDGTHRRENITDWTLEQFRSHFHDPSITKWGIFHYIYAVLPHPEYRERYAANLRRELPASPSPVPPPIFVIPNRRTPERNLLSPPAAMLPANSRFLPPVGMTRLSE